jgi:hypothetical protein
VSCVVRGVSHCAISALFWTAPPLNRSPFRFFHRLTVFSFVLLPLSSSDYHMAMDELRNAIIHAEATEFNKSI